MRYDTGMIAAFVTTAGLLLGTVAGMSDEKKLANPQFNFQTAREHELKPHRHSFPEEGSQPQFNNQLRLTLTVSATGEVTEAKAAGDPEVMKFWPKIQGEVYQWRFKPFEKDGQATRAEIEEYVDFVPAERVPKTHVIPPTIRPDSKITITLQRSICFGTCPGYAVIASTTGIVFNGEAFVVATGTHTDTVDPAAVRKLASAFVAADFYSMDADYAASVTDCPSYSLSIDIDGHAKRVDDYMGSWVGMPAIITELEEQVDTFAETDRWIKGTQGLVPALQAEKYNFKTFQAQTILKEAASRGNTETLHELLAAGVPLQPLPAPATTENHFGMRLEHSGWLTAASQHTDSLRALIEASASKDDQADKDLALSSAARFGNLDGVRTLIAYGANPNADLNKQINVMTSAGTAGQAESAGSILINAAESGNPEIVKEILRYHPQLEIKDRDGKTAVFLVGQYGPGNDDTHVECLSLLANAGANIQARDSKGNTALHTNFNTAMLKELLKLGVDVNARNNDGETPIFTTFDNDAIPLFVEHGADLSIRNNKGQTVFDTAMAKWPQRAEALQKALQSTQQK